MGRIEIKGTVNNQIMFNIVADNGEIVGTSETYKNISGVKTGIESVRRNAESPIEDQTIPDFKREKHAKWEVFLDKSGQYRFRLKAKNGRIILASEGYKNKSKALNGIDSIRRNIDGIIFDLR